MAEKEEEGSEGGGHVMRLVEAALLVVFALGSETCARVERPWQ